MNEVAFGDRLLAVDDEPAIGRLIRKAAQGTGFEVVVTDSPETFSRTARYWHPTVILLDLRMPGTDGIQLLRMLAADKCAAHVVVVSGSDGKVMDSAMRLGHERGLNMSGMLQKPIRLEDLRAMLARFKRAPKALMAADLAEAITLNRLFLEYQPKFNPRIGRFIGVEALVRWRDPSHGIIRPDQFIPLAEETGQIHRLTDWVVAEAARQAAIWRAGGRPLDVAVNISAADIVDLDLPERLQQHCSDAGVDPALLTLELTETGAMREAVQMMDVLTRLRLKGFRLSIDDFGTGYSSLVQLQRMPFSEIKIDQSFVMQMTSNQGARVIVEIVAELARKLKLHSVAEGVEDAATLAALIEMGCDTVQGYHLSRPIPADGILPLLRDYAPSG
jgi:EAL domain-containing protein (putative c-di-GMP-specific phosphodiesterase class I)